MIEQWVQVKFERLITLRKKFKILTDDAKDVRRELAEALKKELQSIIETVSIEDFMKYFCKFSSYKEEVTDNGIIKGNRVYY